MSWEYSEIGACWLRKMRFATLYVYPPDDDGEWGWAVTMSLSGTGSHLCRSESAARNAAETYYHDILNGELEAIWPLK